MRPTGFSPWWRAARSCPGFIESSAFQAVSNLIGAIEIVVAALIVLRPFSAKLSFIGSIGAVITFLLTLSFLFSTRERSISLTGFLCSGMRANSSSRTSFSWAHRSGLRRKHGKKISRSNYRLLN